jgi:hypothetical protein
LKEVGMEALCSLNIGQPAVVLPYALWRGFTAPPVPAVATLRLAIASPEAMRDLARLAASAADVVCVPTFAEIPIDGAVVLQAWLEDFAGAPSVATRERELRSSGSMREAA